MMPETNFDWVRARFECSPTKVFQQLKRQIEKDVETRNDLRSPDSNFGFDTTSQGNSITVFVQGNRLHRSVIFEQTDLGITVRDGDDKMLYDATLTISNDGECRLKVGSVECESWQFRKLALEGLFFDDPWRRLDL